MSFNQRRLLHTSDLLRDYKQEKMEKREEDELDGCSKCDSQKGVRAKRYIRCV